MALEDVQSIQQGAEVLANLMNQGLSRDSAESVVVKELSAAHQKQRRTQELRQAQRERYQQRNRREGNRGQAEEFLAQNDAEYDFIGSPVDEEDLIRTLEIEAGENPQELFDESGLQDKSKRQDYEIKREKAKRVSKNENSKRADRFQQRAYEAEERQKAFDFGLVPLGDSAVADAEGIASYAGPGPSSEERQADVENDRQEGRRAVRESRRRSDGLLTGQEISAESVRRARRAIPEGQSFDPEDAGFIQRRDAIANELEGRRARAESGGIDAARQDSLRSAADEAFNIARSDIGQRAQQGQRNIDRIAQIKAIGAVKDKNPVNMTREAMFDDSASYETAARMVNPEGVTVGYADPRGDAFLGDINSANTANMANAPQLPRGYDWVAQNVGGTGGRAGATSFGEPSPVDITGTLRDFVGRVNGGGDDGVISNIRSMGEFEGAVDRVIQKAEQKGDSLFSYNTEAGKNTAATAPGVDEVLNKLHYSGPEKSRLAQALFQLSAAQESGVNQSSKDSYAARTAGPTQGVNFGALGDDVRLARVRNEKYGKGSNRREVRAALANLSDPDAARPFIGAVEGEGAPRAKFISGEARKLTPDERIRKFGAKNASIANQVEERYENDRKAKEVRLSNTVDPVSARERKLDEEFSRKGGQIELDQNAREIGELRRLQAAGKLNVPSDSSFNQNPKFQSITSAPVPTSIAPEPGAGTGSQTAPQIDAGGSMMGGGNGNRAIGGYMSEPDGPGMSERGYRSAPEGPSSAKSNAQRRLGENLQQLDSAITRRLGRRGRRGASIAAGIGGGVALGNMITGEREEREEEMYR